MQLATELRESGVDVVLDKWDLREGHDAHAFMERMVTDPSVSKVVLVCDRIYAEKADTRSGGVGSEAQIITPRLYGATEQSKFVAVLAERSAEGEPYLPAYYAGRIYIDLSSPSDYTRNFEQLLRWVFDKPLFTKPPIGAAPVFLGESEATNLATRPLALRVIDTSRSNPDLALPTASEYFERLVDQFELLRLDPSADPFDEAVVTSIEVFLPSRDEVVDVVHALALYDRTAEMAGVLHSLFERLIPYLHRPEGGSAWREWDFDNYRFVVHELFLHTLGVLIRHRRYDAADHLLRYDYFVRNHATHGNNVMVPYVALREYMPSLEARNKRLELRRLSLRSDLLNERCAHARIQFRELMQADFLLYVRDLVARPGNYSDWWPETLLYASHQYGPFELFARGQSQREFERIKALLGVESKEELSSMVERTRSPEFRGPRWQHRGFSVEHLLGHKELATRP